MSNTPVIRWLHFTDLHMGLKDGDWLWPNAEHNLLDDIDKQFETAGPWDLVLFTGDLVQQGKEEEYKKFESEFLDVLWERFKALGCDPQLLVVPGNHDLQWQDAIDVAAVGMLEMWHQKPEVSEKFWEETGNAYKQAVRTAFSDFDNWWKNTKYRPTELIPGFLPGDFLFPYKKDGFELGIVGLNSAFLQLTGAKDYKGRLELHHNQCRTDDGTKYTSWLSSNHANILMTHHPTDWLHPDAKKRLNGELKQFFALHLCGHNHQTALHQQLTGTGKYSPLQWTGRSLFGLEKYDDGKVDREHGYAAGVMGVKSESEGYTQFRPRWRFEHEEGAWNIDRDPHGAESDSLWSREFVAQLLKEYGGVSSGIDAVHSDGGIGGGKLTAWAERRLLKTLRDNERFCSILARELDPDDGKLTAEPQVLCAHLIKLGVRKVWRTLSGDLWSFNSFQDELQRVLFLLLQTLCDDDLVSHLKVHFDNNDHIGDFAVRVQVKYAVLAELLLSSVLQAEFKAEDCERHNCVTLVSGSDSHLSKMDLVRRLAEQLEDTPDSMDDLTDNALIAHVQSKLRAHYDSHRPYYIAHSNLDRIGIAFLVEFIMPVATSGDEELPAFFKRITDDDAYTDELIKIILSSLALNANGQ